MSRTALGLELGHALRQIVDRGGAPDFSHQFLVPIRKLAFQLFETCIEAVEPIFNIRKLVFHIRSELLKFVFHIRPKLFLLGFQSIDPDTQLAELWRQKILQCRTNIFHNAHRLLPFAVTTSGYQTCRLALLPTYRNLESPLVRGCRVARAGRDFEANLGAALGVKRGLEVEIGGGALQGFFGAGLGFLGALHIDLLGALSGIGEDGDLLRQHFGEAPRDRKIMRVRTLTIADLADGQAGNQRRVTGQNAEFPALTRDLYSVDTLAHQHFVGGYDFEFQRVSHRGYAAAFIFSASSSTSSMEPFM